MNITVFSLETEEVVGRDRIIKEALTVNVLIGDKKGSGFEAKFELFPSEIKRTAKDVRDIIIKAIKDVTKDPVIYFDGGGFCGGEIVYKEGV